MIQSELLTIDIVENLPNISIDMNDVKFTDGEFKNLRYAGLCIVQYYYTEELKYHCGVLKNFLSEEDIYRIKIWFCKENFFYLDRYYRLDFDEYIYLFQVFNFEGGELMVGNLLKKDLELRLDLASMHQKRLMGLLINGDRQPIYATG